MAEHNKSLQPVPEEGGESWCNRLWNSLRFRLLLALNLAILGSLAIFLIWGYWADWSRILQEKRSSLKHQAQAVVTFAIRHADAPREIEDYIGEMSRRMAESDLPGRIIAVDWNGKLLYAGPKSDRKKDMYRALQEAVKHEEGKAQAPGGLIVASQASADGVRVFVSEYRDKLNVTPRTAIMRQVFQTLRLAVVLTLVISLISHRVVIRKIGALVDVVRRVRGGELGAQVEEPMPSELRLLSGTVNSMSSRLAEVEQERSNAMKKARRIEERLRPLPEQVGDMPVAWDYRPATEVAGDFFDIHRDGDQVIFVVADVTGHGVPAALGAAMLKILFEDAVSHIREPGAILAAINRRFMKISLDEDFCTMAIAALDRERGTLRYASAGHEPAVLLRGSRVRRNLDSTGPVLGVVEESAWETTTLDVTSEDTLFLYTDGLTETHSPDGEPLGRERLVEWLQQVPADEPDMLVKDLLRKTDDFRSAERQEDDITVLAAKL